jgi:hypothetical protein
MLALFDWWRQLATVNQVFFGIAAFFSILFLWQFIMTLIGLAGHGEADVGGAEADAGGDVDTEMEAEGLAGHEVAGHDFGEHGGEYVVGEHETALSFRLLSVRSVITAGMLFGWAGALYLHNGVALANALVYAILWALAGGMVIAMLMYLMRRLQETGTPRLSTCVGRPATVYMDIPAGGTGKVRTVVSGAMSFVAARSASGQAVKAGTPVRVVRLVDAVTVEVEGVTKPEGGAP